MTLTSEERLGVQTPGDHQCERLDGIIDELEQLRTAVEETRAWGFDWKRLAKELIEKYEPERLDDYA